MVRLDQRGKKTVGSDTLTNAEPETLATVIFVDGISLVCKESNRNCFMTLWDSLEE